jgi:uncharacterized protein (DUF433 family)
VSKSVRVAPHIVVDPGILSGETIVAGTRISVELILCELSIGATPFDLVRSYPTLTL